MTQRGGSGREGRKGCAASPEGTGKRERGREREMGVEGTAEEAVAGSRRQRSESGEVYGSEQWSTKRRRLVQALLIPSPFIGDTS